MPDFSDTAWKRMRCGAGPDRRTVLKTAGAAAAALPLGLGGSARAAAAGRPIKIGMVAPLTGPLAAFAEADGWVLGKVRAALGSGIMSAGGLHPVQIIEKDSQSSTSRAAEVASDLILNDEVDIMVTSNTADTVNPVADQCEANEVPCISTDSPWQPYYFGRGATVERGFDYTYHFFWGVDDLMAVYLDLWNSLPTNKLVGGMWANDIEGNAMADGKTGFPPALAKGGYKLIDPGRYPPGAQDFSAQIARFKANNVEILTGVFAPPDFTTFWNQAAQQGFKPKIATIAKALLFPSAVEALGKAGNGLSSEVWWSPHHPFSSSLIPGLTAAKFCDEYMATTKKQWTQPIGFKLAMLEVAIDVLKRAKSIDRDAIMNSLRATNLNTIVGPVHWTGKPVKNVCTTPLVGGQWRPGTRFPYDLVIVNDMHSPEVPVAGKLEPLPT